MTSLRATAAPLLESDVGGTALLASFRQDSGGFRLNFAGFRAQTECKSSKIWSSRRNFENLREEASPRSCQERPRAAPKPLKSAQERAKGVKLAARRVPEKPQEASQGALERPRRPFWRSEDRRNRLSRATSGVTRSKSAFEAVFWGFSKRARKRGNVKNLWFSWVFRRSRLLRESKRSRG